MNPGNKGQSVTKYAILLGLCVVVAVSVIFSIGGWTRDSYDNMITHKGPTPPLASLPPTVTPAVLPPTPPASVPPAGTPPSGAPVFTLGSYPSDLANTVETSGIDGAFKQYADAIQELAENLKDKELNEEQYQKLLTFAALIRQTGLDDKLGQLKQLKENLSKPVCSTSPGGSDPNLPIPADCILPSMRAELLKQMDKLQGNLDGIEEDTDDKVLAFIEDPRASSLPFSNSNTFQYKMTQMMVDINKDGSLKNPDVKKLIGDTVLKTSLLAGHVGRNIKNGTSNLDQLTDQVVQDLKKTNLKRVVNCASSSKGLQSGNICLK